MMTPQEFFRKAAEERRDLLVSLAVTGSSALQELVVSEIPVHDTSIPQEADKSYCQIGNRYQYIRN